MSGTHVALVTLSAAVAGALSWRYRYVPLMLWGAVHYFRFRRTSSTKANDRSIVLARAAVSIAPERSEALSLMLSALGDSLMSRFELGGDRRDIEEAIALGRRAVALGKGGPADRATCMSSLGAYLERRYARFGDERDLAEALRCFRQAIATTVSDADKAGFLANLAGALTTSVRRTSSLPDITTAVTTARQALELRSGPITRLNALTALSNALGLRADLTGSTDDHDEALRLLRRVVDATPPHHVLRLRRAQNLVQTLWMEYLFTGRLENLDEAVTVARDTVAGTPDGHMNAGLHYAALSSALVTRYHHSGRLSDINEAIAVMKTGLSLTAADHADYHYCLSQLGSCHRARHGRIGDRVDLDRLIGITGECARAVPEDPFYANDHAIALLDRYVVDDDPGDLDQAIEVLTGATTEAAKGSQLPTGFALCHGNLALLLYQRYARDGAPAVLEEAIRTARRAVDLASPRSDTNARCFYILGLMLQGRYDRDRLEMDARSASDALREAMDERGAPVGLRLAAARHLGDLHGRTGAFLPAATVFRRAAALLPMLAVRRLTRPDQEYHLSRHAGLASDGAAMALSADRPDLAVEILEAGRSVLWTQLLDDRADLDSVAKVAPDLVKRMKEVRLALSAAEMEPAPEHGRHPQGGGS